MYVEFSAVSIIFSNSSELFWALSISFATFLMVGSSINFEIFRLTLVFSKIIAFSFINVNDVNPTAYKSSVTPNSSVSAIDAAISYSIFSVSVSGATNSKLSTGFGSFLRNIFPFGVFGISSNCINTVGTIYWVNLSCRYFFNFLISISSSAVKYAHKWSLLLIFLTTTAVCFTFGNWVMFDSISPISILSPLSFIWLSILPFETNLPSEFSIPKSPVL